MKEYNIKLAGILTGDPALDALITAEGVRLYLLTLTCKAESFAKACDLAQELFSKYPQKTQDARIWGVEEVDPEEEDE